MRREEERGNRAGRLGLGGAPVSARRPTRRYYLARTADRCEVYSVDGGDFSAPAKTPCPQDLEPGERFRITGRTCIRETTDPPARSLSCAPTR